MSKVHLYALPQRSPKLIDRSVQKSLVLLAGYYSFSAPLIPIYFIDSDWIDSVPFGAERTCLLMDGQFTASSSKDNKSEASHARLNLDKGGWMPAEDDRNPWLQIDFILNVTITAIATQGLTGTNMSFVANYTLDFGYDGANFEDYKYNGFTKVRILVYFFKPVFHLAIFFLANKQKANVIGCIVMSLVFVASQSNSFFFCSREQIRLVENRL